MQQPETKYLHYKKYGAGPDYLLAFHGFGQNESVFQLFEFSLGKQYTILAFDLFFHGQSKWPTNELPVRIADWISLLQVILDKEGITSFSLMGYSLGGKLALATALEMPSRVEKIILVATDGIYLNPWYRIATGTAFMRFIFRYLNERPAILEKLIGSFSRGKFISDRLARFAISQVADKNNSQLIYYSWVGFRHFTSNTSSLVDAINRNKIHITIVAGKYDTVIPYLKLKTFAEKCANATFILINTGHNSLLKKYHESLLELRETADTR